MNKIFINNIFTFSSKTESEEISMKNVEKCKNTHMMCVCGGGVT